MTEGIILRSKVNWYEHGEKSSQYFLNLEKRNKARSFLKKIFVSNGTKSTDPDEIFQLLELFIQNCIKNKALKPKTIVSTNYELPCLMENDSFMEGKLTK